MYNFLWSPKKEKRTHCTPSTGKLGLCHHQATGTLSHPARGRLPSLHLAGFVSRVDPVRGGAQGHSLGKRHPPLTPPQTLWGLRWQRAVSCRDWCLQHRSPSELRLVSSRARPGCPRVSCRTRTSLTSLPTEALLPLGAGTTPCVRHLDDELGHHQAGPLEPLGKTSVTR